MQYIRWSCCCILLWYFDDLFLVKSSLCSLFNSNQNLSTHNFSPVIEPLVLFLCVCMRVNVQLCVWVRIGPDQSTCDTVAMLWFSCCDHTGLMGALRFLRSRLMSWSGIMIHTGKYVRSGLNTGWWTLAVFLYLAGGVRRRTLIFLSLGVPPQKKFKGSIPSNSKKYLALMIVSNELTPIMEVNRI